MQSQFLASMQDPFPGWLCPPQFKLGIHFAGIGLDILPTNQTTQVLILNVGASKFIEILEESLLLDLVHFFVAALETRSRVLTIT